MRALGIFVPERARIRFFLTASTTNTLIATLSFALKGVRQPPKTFEFAHTSGDRVLQTFDMGLIEEAEILSLRVSGPGKRGQNWCEAYLIHRGEFADRLLIGYVHDGNGLALGDHTESGPGTGTGHLQWVALADDVTPVDITRVLAATNTFRRIYGFVWYYESSGDVATRTLRVQVQAPGLSIPTGFSIAEVVNLPHSGAVSLTQNEQGIVFAYSKDKGSGMSSRNDNGTLTTSDLTTQPSVFPIDVVEDDLWEIFFDVGGAEAADRHSIFLYQEEWIVV